MTLKSICNRIIRKELGGIGAKLECMKDCSFLKKGQIYVVENSDKIGPKINGDWFWWSERTAFRKVS